MSCIKADRSHAESKSLQASAVTSTAERDTAAPVPAIWGSDWRQAPLFGGFSPPQDKAHSPVVVSAGPKTRTTDSLSPPAWKGLPATFTFSFPVPEAQQSFSCPTEPPNLLSIRVAPKRDADRVPSPKPTPRSVLPELTKEQTMDRRRLLVGLAPKHDDGLYELETAPIFTESARAEFERQATESDARAGQAFSQYGLLAGAASSATSDELFYYNVATPSSVFICGSQGSGKSHTLSCLLENSLFPSVANELPRPLTGIVFHYDTFISDIKGSPCEAAYLSSNPAVQVRVLCAPTNVATIRRTYAGLPNVAIEPLSIKEQDLTTKRIMDLMAMRKGEAMPLYMHVVNRILRDLRLRQQTTGGSFSYRAFKKMLSAETLTESQKVPLSQRLETLESFMALSVSGAPKKKTAPEAAAARPPGNDWRPRPGQLTIVDLSCPTIPPEGACALFNICLSLFLEQDATKIGRIVALDEAHKYMTDSGEASALTEQLLATIRLQRHLGARVVISTQEPTVSPRLLDLCSVTVVHRFTSPEWLRTLRRHLAGAEETAVMLAQAAAAEAAAGGDSDGFSDSGVDDLLDGAVEGVGKLSLQGRGATAGQKQAAAAAASLFAQIVGLRVGEALVFSPNAVVGVDSDGAAKKLGSGVLKVRVRNRVTEDGGRSVMAG